MPLLDVLFGLPGWTLSVVGAALFGIAGMFLARPFVADRPGIARYLPLALFIIGYGVTDRFALPALLQSDLAVCAAARASAEQTRTERGGTSPDPATSFVAATADCGARSLVISYRVRAPRSAVDPSGLAAVEAAFTADTCGMPQLRQLLAQGWRVESVYEFGDGEALTIAATC